MVRADHKVARNRLLKRLPTGPELYELGQSTRPKSRRVNELGSSYECRTADCVPRGVHGNDFGEFRWSEGRLWDKKYSSVSPRTRFLQISRFR